MFKIIISIFFAAAAVIIFLTQTKNNFAEVKNLRATVASYDSAMAESKKIKETLNSLLEQYNSISQSEMEKIKKVTPSSPEPMSFIVEIDEIASQNGLTMKNIEIKERTEEESLSDGAVPINGAKTMAFTARLNGTYESFINFLKDLEKDLRIVDVSSVKFVPSSSGNFDFSLEAAAYWTESASDGR